MADRRDLVLVTVSGVQNYISQSRTTRDVTAASAIMSDLAGRGALAVDGLMSGSDRHRVVLPAAANLPAGLPNRIVFSCPAGTGAAAARLAVDAVRHQWEELVSAAFRGGPVPQTPGFPDVQWVVSPAAEHDSYGSQFEEVQSLAAGRKATRTFSAPAFDNRRPLCSLSPGWRSVEAPRDARAFERDESLAAHNWVKRMHGRRGGGGNRVPSTWAIASAPYRLWLAGVLRLDPAAAVTLPGLARAVGHLVECWAESIGSSTDGRLAALDGAVRDGDPADAVWLLRDAGSWVFPTYWSVRHLQEADVSPDRAAEASLAGADAARTVARLAREVASELAARDDPIDLDGDPRLTPYLAIVVQDIDDLGQRVRAHLSPPQATEEDHRALSGALVARASRQVAAARQAMAWPVYAGGDDTLVFAPVVAALPLVDDLAACDDADGEPEALAESTVSTGVAFVHAGASLNASLNHARAMLVQAKGIPGKNGVAIGYLKRAGSAATTVRPRTTRRQSGALVEATDLLRRLADDLAGPASQRLIHDLSRGFDGVARRHPDDPTTLPRPLLELRVPHDHTRAAAAAARDLQRGEIARLVARHTDDDPHGAGALAGAVIDAADTETAAESPSPTAALKVARFLVTVGGSDE